MKPSALADASGASRWSICRWLKRPGEKGYIPNATITIATWDKIDTHMAKNP